jgi:hypothetical protein
MRGERRGSRTPGYVYEGGIELLGAYLTGEGGAVGEGRAEEVQARGVVIQNLRSSAKQGVLLRK